MNLPIKIWVPASLMIAAAAVFATYEITIKGMTEIGFAKSCSIILVMLSPLLAFLVLRKVSVEKKPSQFGGGWRIFISTAICTAAVVLINVVANLTRTFAFQVETWEIYGFYVLIAVSEEVYYRVFIVYGLIYLLSTRNKIVGVLGATCVVVLAIYAGFQLDPMIKIALLGASVLVFLVYQLVPSKRKEHVNMVFSIPACIVSAVMFSLAHWNVYAAYPEMTIATLLGGGVMAAFLVVTRNPFVPIFAHFTNNLLSLRGIIIN
jgi:hypothetical protein